jgi:hypothetical protein
VGYVDVRKRRAGRVQRGWEPAGLWHAAVNSPYLSLAVGLTIGLPYSWVIAPEVLPNPYPLGYAILWMLPALFGIAFVCRGIWQLREGGQRSTRPRLGGEKQLLMAIRDMGGITPVEAALETSLTVDEAEEILSRLASRGHLLVESRDGVLSYALPGRRPG